MHGKLVKFAFHYLFYEAFQISAHHSCDTRGGQSQRTAGTRKRRQYYGY